MKQIDCVAIIGVGLIGGSFGMAIKKRGLANYIIGIGRNPERLKKAVNLGAIDDWTTDVEAGVRNADLIYISTPVGLEVDFIRQAAMAAKSGCIITDAGSTKTKICKDADKIIRKDVYFIGGHPMAGSEMTGVEAANPDLFVNAAYVLTPTSTSEPNATAVVRAIAEAIGARVIVMEPEIHDRCVAAISHLTHIIAAALVSLAHEYSLKNPQILDLVAGSFRDMTRVASSSPVLWRDICMTNIEEIQNAAASFKEHLAQGLRAL
ncbi:MAG: prephenate dehydrogenase/arogenate dehydrogenase family protein, partial [Armatimonadota bacterium]|nr:prephenate dehydrogenase/arogenate dehydrogenase family protein [Armatimonadota bacterium]